MKRVVVITAGLVLLAVLAAGFWIYQSLEQPYRGFSEAEVFVDIPPGTGTAGMARRLADAGVVPSATVFEAAVYPGEGTRLRSMWARQLRCH